MIGDGVNDVSGSSYVTMPGWVDLDGDGVVDNKWGLIAGLLVGTLGVDLMLWLLLPELTFYCGLSGVLNSLLLLALAGGASISTSAPESTSQAISVVSPVR